MKAGVMSVLSTSTSKSPNVFLSLPQYAQSDSGEHKETSTLNLYYASHI